MSDKEKIIIMPGTELLHLKTFRRPWIGWLYCRIWLRLTTKGQKPDTTRIEDGES